MADEEHLAKLKEGVEEWNAWRDAHEEVQIDLSNAEFSYYPALSGANLSEVNLHGANLTCADLSGVNLRGANLSKADLSWANLCGADLSETNLSKADLNWANLCGANLSKADLNWANLWDIETDQNTRLDEKWNRVCQILFWIRLGKGFYGIQDADLSHANLRGASFRSDDFRGTNFNFADLREVDFRKADLSAARLHGADLSDANLSDANLSDSELYGATLNRAKLSNANLKGAVLDRASLRQANLVNANLIRASLKEADLTTSYLVDAQLNGANLTKAVLVNALLSNSNLTNANLTAANLTGANLVTATLIRAQFTQACLKSTDLTRISASEADFSGTELTGACIQEWGIGFSTKLNDITCRYIYLRNDRKERRPSDPSQEFLLGEFNALIQKILHTVDLVFINDKELYERDRQLLEAQLQFQQECITGLTGIVKTMVEKDTSKVTQYFTAPVTGVAGNVEGSQYINNLQGVDIANFANQLRDSASQNASQFSQTIGQNANDIAQLITVLQEQAQQFPDIQRDDALIGLNNLQQDLSTSEKREPNRIKGRLVALLAIAGVIATPIATATDFANNVLELADKVGIPPSEIIQYVPTHLLPPHHQP